MSERPTPTASAFEQALKLLNRRDYARKALSDRLYKLGHSRPDIDAAVERLTELRYLDDARYALAVVRTRALQSGWGRKRIVLDLRKRGVDESTALAALDEFEAASDELDEEMADWSSRARRLVTRKFGEEPPKEPKEWKRRIAFLMRRGFSYEQARRAIEAREDAP